MLAMYEKSRLMFWMLHLDPSTATGRDEPRSCIMSFCITSMSLGIRTGKVIAQWIWAFRDELFRVCILSATCWYYTRSDNRALVAVVQSPALSDIVNVTWFYDIASALPIVKSLYCTSDRFRSASDNETLEWHHVMFLGALLGQVPLDILLFPYNHQSVTVSVPGLTLHPQ